MGRVLCGSNGAIYCWIPFQKKGLKDGIGRDSEDEDDTHGDKSVVLIRKKNIRIKGIQLSKKGYRIAKLLIRHHCRDDKTGIDRVTKVPNFTSRDIVRAHKLYCIAKDMDGLDWVRFNGLDFRQLRPPYARRCLGSGRSAGRTASGVY